MELFLAPELNILCFLLRIDIRMERHVIPDNLVRPLLNLLKLLLPDLPAQVDCHPVITHMESYILIAKAIMDEAAHDVFAGMILHPVKAELPVQDTMYSCSCWNFRFSVTYNIDIIAVTLRICNGCFSSWKQVREKIPSVPILTTALREKGTFVQIKIYPILPIPAGNDACVKLFQVCIFIIKLLRHSCFSFFLPVLVSKIPDCSHPGTLDALFRRLYTENRCFREGSVTVGQMLSDRHNNLFTILT